MSREVRKKEQEVERTHQDKIIELEKVVENTSITLLNNTSKILLCESLSLPPPPPTTKKLVSFEISTANLPTGAST